MSRKISIVIGCLVFVLLALPVVGGAYSELVHQFQYSRRGWDSELKEGRIIVRAVNPLGPAASLLRAGDEVISLQAQPADKANMPLPTTDFWRVPPGSKYGLTIRRDGQTQELSLQTVAFTPSARFWIRLGLLLPLVKLFFLIDGLIVFLLKPADRQAQLLALMLGTLAAVIPVGQAHLSGWFLQLVALAQVLAMFVLPICVHFFLIFPERSPLLRRFPRLIVLLYVAYALLTMLWYVLRVTRAFWPLGATLNWLPRQPWMGLTAQLTAVAYMVATLLALVINYRAAGTEARRKLHVIAAGSGLGFVNLFLLPTGEYLGLTPRFPTLWSWFDLTMPFTLTLIPLSFAYAIIRHKVIPVSLMIRRGVRYVLVSRGAAILLMGVVWIAVTIILTAIFSRLQPPGIVIGVISAAVGVIVWNAASRFHQRYLAPVIDRAFFRQSYDTRQILAELAQSLRATGGLPQLLEQAATKIQSALQTENVTIFLREDASGDYRSAYTCEYSQASGRAVTCAGDHRLPHHSEVIGKLAQKSSPLEVELNIKNEFGAVERATLQQIKTNLLLPLSARDELLGIVSLGPRLGDLPYSGEDEQLLMTVAGPVTFAIENARLVERMIEEARRRQELETENERRAKELEEARQLQLSMLPKAIPQLPHIEIAAYMKTATEVGGDYYDFYLAEDGALTVAIGDATGHGLRAGTMVSAVKSLFVSHAYHPDIPQIFDRLSRVLKQMNLRSLFMAMAMVKVKDNQLIVSSAGMPPVLVYRAASGEVEEIAIRGIPLGSVTNYSYKQQEAVISTGDVVVMMSDGLPERFNQRREMLDYAPIKQTFAEIAGQSPQEIIAQLINTGERWADGRPQDDDITFVVIKITESK